MFEFSVKGKRVVVKVQCKKPIESYSVELKYDCIQEPFAKLLCDNLEKAYHETVMAVREEEYRQGRADEKSHRAKRTWFYRRLEVSK